MSSSQFIAIPILRVAWAVIHDTSHLMVHHGWDPFTILSQSHPCKVGCGVGGREGEREEEVWGKGVRGVRVWVCG